MTIEEITERILEAAAIERRMPRAKEKPTAGNGYCLPWVHTQADINGWRKEVGDKIHRGHDPLKEWRAEFWDSAKSPVSAAEVSRWEEVRQWFIDRLDDPAERRALWAWAASKHGGKSFAKFCRAEGIHVETGRRRKKRAIECISASFGGRTGQHSENDASAVLMDDREIIYFSDTFEADAYEEKTPLRYTWRDDPSMKPLFETGRGARRKRRVDARALRSVA